MLLPSEMSARSFKTVMIVHKALFLMALRANTGTFMDEAIKLVTQKHQSGLNCPLYYLRNKFNVTQFAFPKSRVPPPPHKHTKVVLRVVRFF